MLLVFFLEASSNSLLSQKIQVRGAEPNFYVYRIVLHDL